MRVERINVADGVARLIAVSDLHGFIEPLEALDDIIHAMPERVQVVVVGDIVMGGPDPAEAVEWVRKRAGEFAVLGNHDEVALMGADGEDPAYTEPGSFQRLNSEQAEYLRSLPEVLELGWRGIRIRVMHGHRTYLPEGDSRAGMERFDDPAFALTIIGHTHNVFAPGKDDPKVADCGATCKFIFDCRQGDGTFLARPDHPSPAPDSEMYGTFLSLTADGGELEAAVGRFDYDRQGAIRRVLELEGPNCYSRIPETLDL